MLPGNWLDEDMVMFPDDGLGRVEIEVAKTDVGPGVETPVEDAWLILRDGIPIVDIGP